VAALAALSHRMVQAMTEGGQDPARVRAGLDNLLEVFTREHRIRRVDGDEVLRLAFGRVEAHAAVLGLPAGPRAMAERLRESMLGSTPAATAETPSPEPDPEAAERVFTRGIQETTRLVLGDPPISELVLVVLETALRGLEEHGAERVAFLLRDPARPALRFRSGLGPGLEEAREWMTVDLTAERDPFFHALTQGIDVHLEDLPAARVFHTLPPWFRRKTGVLIILPLLVQGRSLGVFLVEGSGKRRISEKVLDYLRILRDQVVLSIVKGAQKASPGT
jgi:hypothetical protein